MFRQQAIYGVKNEFFADRHTEFFSHFCGDFIYLFFAVTFLPNVSRCRIQANCFFVFQIVNKKFSRNFFNY